MELTEQKVSPLALQGNMPEILQIEEYLKTLEQVDLPVTEYRIPGVYVRSMFIPAGTILTGKIHNGVNIAILAQGSIRISNSDESYILNAPHIMIDRPGIKRLGMTETDVTFITVHRLDEGVSADTLVSDTFEEYETKLLTRSDE